MKRDVDLCRQLLVEIESRGPDCALGVVRTSEQDGESRVRHHLRLLVDAGYLKEVDRTSDGVPCVRLTDQGHEFIELSRGESRWREAKRVGFECTGGTSLTVVREILLQWALAPVRRVPARRYYAATPEPLPPRAYGRYAGYPFEPHRDDDWEYAPEEVRYLCLRPHEHAGWRAPYGEAEVAVADGQPTLPEHLI